MMGPGRLMRVGIIILFALFLRSACAGEKIYSFGVLNQRNPALTAQYWNPILEYVSKKSGVRLQLRMGKNVQETDGMTERGEFDFIYSNHIFMPRNPVAGYRVIARPSEKSIEGQIVVLENSPIHSLKELEGREVAFPSETAFVAYAVTMDALLREGIRVKTVFAGNQEGVMGQLKAGRVPAASVNSEVMREFARRQQIHYRVLWSSEKFAPMPIAVHRGVGKKQMQAVRKAFAGMAADPEGLKVLKACADVVKQGPPYGFAPASDREYENQKDYYRTTMVKGF